MRKTFYLLLAGVILLALTSCHKEQEDKISETAEFIRGTYRLKSITWEGSPVDLNNDGVKGNDLYEELLSLPMNQISAWTGTVSGNVYRSTASIGLQMPIQGIKVDEFGNYYGMAGGMWVFSISGTINSDGTIEANFDRFNVNEYDRLDLRKMHDGLVLFDMTGKGSFSFRVHATLYDRLTGSLVEGVITYCYEWFSPEII